MSAEQNAAADSDVSAVYKHTQKGGLVFYLTGLVTVCAVAIVCLILANAYPMGDTIAFLLLLLVFAVTLAALVWSTVMLSSMTVTVEKEFVRVVFGPHFFTKEFALKDITACGPAKNDFWDNWGIRMWGSGWLYNVAGFDAVEITMTSGRHNRIGTDRPRELAEAIQKALSRFSSVKENI